MLLEKKKGKKKENHAVKQNAVFDTARRRRAH